MEPVTTVIITALTIGATKIAEGTLSKVGEDAYNGLKNLLSKKIENQEIEDAIVLEEFVDNPKENQEKLNNLLIGQEMHKDNELIEKANEFLELMPQKEIGKYNINFNAPVKNVITGDKHTLTINFNDKDEKE